jgi:hypothetical protein
VSLCIPSSSRSPDHDPHRTIYYLGYPLGRFASLKHQQGQRGATGPRSGLGRPAWAHFSPTCSLLCPVLLPKSSRVFPQLHVGPCRQFLFGLDEAPCPAGFGSFLTRSSEFSIFSGLVLGHFGVMFTSLPDLYRASRSCHEVLNELIP